MADDKYKRAPVDSSVNGTSFHDHTIRATVVQLTALFGEPMMYGDKTTREWNAIGPNGEVVTIYDYKYDGAKAGYWHLGGREAGDTLRFKTWLERNLPR